MLLMSATGQERLFEQHRNIDDHKEVLATIVLNFRGDQTLLKAWGKSLEHIVARYHSFIGELAGQKIAAEIRLIWPA